MAEATVDFQKLGVDFQNNLRQFIERTDDLSKKSLARVQKALAAYPLEEGIIVLIHEDEKEVYDLGVQIQSLKLNMMIESLRQDAEDERVKASKDARDVKAAKDKAKDGK